MNDQQVDMPRIDETVTAKNLHERAEAVSVPCFDWINGPMIAVIEGLTHPTGRHEQLDGGGRWHRIG